MIVVVILYFLLLGISWKLLNSNEKQCKEEYSSWSKYNECEWSYCSHSRYSEIEVFTSGGNRKNTETKQENDKWRN